MAVRTGYVGTESIGDVLTKANYDKGPGGMVGYLSITANSTGTAGTATVTGLSVAITAGTSRMYKITIQCLSIFTTGTGQTNIAIWDMTGTAQLGATVVTGAGTSLSVPAGDYQGNSCVAYHAPSAGTQTYAFRTVTTASTAGLYATATSPAKIIVEDVGPAF